MRILILGDAPNIHTRRWAAYFVERGHDVHTASLEPGDDIAGTFHALPSASVPRALRYPLATPALRAMIAKLKPDLVNAHFVPNYGFIAALAGARPLATTVWGSDILVSARRSIVHRARATWALHHADLVLTDAQMLTDAVCALGVPRERTLTVPLGVDTTLFARGVRLEGTARAARDVGAEPRVASTRRLEPVYDVGTLLDAAARLLPRRRFALTIAGDGSERTKLERRAAELRIDPHVTFCGALPEVEIAAVLAEADVYVSTSLSDSTSVSLLEAMSAGAFPVVSDIPANREWVAHDRTGLLFPPRDARALALAMDHALSHATLRETAAAENRAAILARATREACMGVIERAFETLASHAPAESITRRST
jgi:glycosyltransferase involved in cell wall biosynthesis